MDKIAEDSRKNGLEVNTNKTKAMIINKKRIEL